jgi:hypothetical protein
MLTVIERPEEVAKKEGIINVQHGKATRGDPSLYKIQSLHHQHLRNCGDEACGVLPMLESAFSFY